MADMSGGEQQPETSLPLLNGFSRQDREQQKEVEKIWQQLGRQAGHGGVALEGSGKGAGSQGSVCAASREGQDLGDSESFATGESPVEEPQEEPEVNAASPLNPSSSSLLWAMPLAPSTSWEDGGLVILQASSSAAALALPSGAQQEMQQTGRQRHLDKNGSRDIAAAKLAGFLQQFQNVLPPQAASDCVVCQLRPVHPDGCGESCSCCSDAKKAAVERLKHQFAVVLPSSEVTAEELLSQRSEQMSLAKLLKDSRSTAQSFEKRLASAEEEKQELQQKLRELLQQQQMLQKKIVNTASHLRMQQEAWQRKDRLQQDQLLFLSAKLKARTKELETLRKLRALESADNEQQQDPLCMGEGFELTRQSPEVQVLCMRPKSCSAFVEIGKKGGAQSGAAVAAGFRPRSKSERPGKFFERKLGRGDYQEEHREEYNISVSSEEFEPLSQLQGLQQTDKQIHKQDGIRHNMFQWDPRQRSHTAPTPHELHPEDDLHAGSSSAKKRVNSAFLSGPKQIQADFHDKFSGLRGDGLVDVSAVVFSMHEDDRHSQQQPQKGRPSQEEEIGKQERVENPLSSLRFEWQNSGQRGRPPSASPPLRGKRIQSCVFADYSRSHQNDSELPHPYPRSHPQLSQSLNTQLECIRQQLLTKYEGAIASLTQPKSGTQRKPDAATTATEKPAGSQGPPQVKFPQSGEHESCLSRVTHSNSNQHQSSSNDLSARVQNLPQENGAGWDPSQGAEKQRDEIAAVQQQLPQEKHGPFECLSLSSGVSEENKHELPKDSADPQKEGKRQQTTHEETRQRKMVRWMGRSRSCSFAAERAATHRLLYLLPKGGTLHPKKLKEMIKGDEVLQAELQLMQQPEPVAEKGFEENEHQQQTREGKNEQQTEVGNQDESTGNEENRGDAAGSGIDCDDQAIPGTNVPSIPHSTGTDNTQGFPQTAHTHAPDHAPLHVEWACRGQVQPKHQYQHHQAHGQQQHACKNEAEKCQLKLQMPTAASLHITLPSPMEQKQQLVQQQQVQHPLKMLTCSQGTVGGFAPLPANIQEALGGSTLCPVALQPAASLSPRPVVFMYSPSFLQQQQQQKPQKQQLNTLQASGSCKTVSCCHGSHSNSSSESSSAANVPECSNSVSCRCEACVAISDRNISTGCSAKGEDRSSRASEADPWCLLCESGTQPVRSGAEDRGPPCTPRDRHSVSNGATKTENASACEGIPAPCLGAADGAALCKEHDAAPPCVTSPRKVQPPQPAVHPDAIASPQNGGANKNEEAGANAGSPRGRTKRNCFFTHLRLRQSTPKGEEGCEQKQQPYVQQTQSEKKECSKTHHQQQHPHKSYIWHRQFIAKSRPPSAVATQTSLPLYYRREQALLAGSIQRLRGPLNMLQAQHILHQGGADYLHPATGDCASFSSSTSFARELPIQPKLQLEPIHALKAASVSAKPGELRNAALVPCLHKLQNVPKQSPSADEIACGEQKQHPHTNKTERQDDSCKAIGAADGKPSQFSKSYCEPEKKAEDAAHDQLEKQIAQLQQWQTRLHHQQHIQHQQLLQHQRLLQQQQKRLQRSVGSGSHQRSVTPQVQQQHRLQLTALPVRYVEMAPPSGGLVYLQVQESPRWIPGAHTQQQGPPYIMPPATGEAATDPVARPRHPVQTTLTARDFAANASCPLTVPPPAELTLPTPMTPTAAPCMLLPVPPSTVHLPGPPSATPQYFTPRPGVSNQAVLFQR